MNQEGKFWTVIWALAATVVITITACTTNYYKDQNAKIVELIKSGADPMESICAIVDDYGNNSSCLIIASKRK